MAPVGEVEMLTKSPPEDQVLLSARPKGTILASSLMMSLGQAQGHNPGLIPYDVFGPCTQQNLIPGRLFVSHSTSPID